MPNVGYSQQNDVTLKGNVNDNTQRGVDSLVVIAKGVKTFTTYTDAKGKFNFGLVPQGNYQITISHINFKNYHSSIYLNTDKHLNINLESTNRVLNEVYITASEARGLTSTSVIDRKAMQHLQPSSFTDLLELLPGGRSVDPNLTGMNQIRLREARNSNGSAVQNSDYDISSLGTAFLIDGAPINTSANLQNSSVFTQTDPNYYRNSVNKGVDMRSLSTDQIERVEVVRGIPSVEYGDLTSGLIKVIRKKGASPYSFRIKTDGFSKLYSVSKGFTIPEKNLMVNADLDFLNSKADPTSNFENYKRINASLRAEKYWDNSVRKLTWNTAFDYGTNVDNQRTDPDNGYALTDSYKSTFNSYALSNTLRGDFHAKNSFFKSFEIATRFSYQKDRIESVKWVQARSVTVLFNSLEAGAHDASYLTPSYASELLVDGQPLNAFIKGKVNLGFNIAAFRHKVVLGFETNYSKNLGDGQIYDLDYPPTATISIRPRAYHDIPGMLNQAFFAEDLIILKANKHVFDLALGLRGMSFLGMNQQYTIANKFYLDPRANLKWTLPEISVGDDQLVMSFGAGYGLHTKMPTLHQLYPEKDYQDIVQLNYYHNNPEFRKANVITYITDRTNFDLMPAVNKKFELNTDVELNGNRLTLTYFNERLNDGFRSTTYAQRLDHKKYDNSSVDAATLASAPSIGDFDYTDASQFYSYSTTTNGSTLNKEGVEMQFSSPRLPGINTRFRLDGAWFKSTYINTFPFYKPITATAVTDGKVLQYIGYYNDTDGYNLQQLNTNLTIDSYLPKLGLILSTSLQNLWFSSKQNDFKSGTPVSYIGIDGIEKPYTEKSAIDPNLNHLKYSYAPSLFRKVTVPIDLQVNFKATKEFKKKASISMFVNRLFTYTPDYTTNGVTVVRQGFNSPYFGIELNVTL
ncbi:TonB-dependent receptor [Pedobacter sp.]|uniref:TonB-dependent receptor n=1 Tax=Pedobacter sp. TaxID=1411316 RepID=UPI003D7FD66C